MAVKNFSKFRLEIRQRLERERENRDTSAIARYLGSVGHEKRSSDERSTLKIWGLSQSIIRQLANEKYSFSDLALSDQLSIWIDFYHSSKIYDELAVALAWMAAKPRRALLLANKKMLFGLQTKVDNWALSDGIADLVAAHVELDPKRGLAQLRKWNRSKNPWERRQSLVGLYYYARLRTTHLPASESLPLVEHLLYDPHYFVQKAVGWSLREIYQVDRPAQLAFVKTHVGSISATAFFATIEKYTDRERRQIKTLRSGARLKS